MGKGDRKTTRGKTSRGSYGNSRPHKEKTVVVTKAVVTSKPAVKKAAPRKKTAV
jgi:ribosomal small subunit protein bTHX